MKIAVMTGRGNMLKSFNELRAIDVSPYIEQRDGYDYLNWAKCIDLLHEHGADKVYFEPIVNDKGSSLFMSDQVFEDKNENTNRCYEVRVKIVIDDNIFYMQSPVMNGPNPVKDNSMSQQRVWNAQTRAFVKGVAIYTGLGSSLWLKDFEVKEDDISKHDILKIRQRVLETVSAKMLKGLTTSDIVKALNITEEELKAYFGYYYILDRLEKNLNRL